MGIDRIETGRVFGNKDKAHEFVRVTRVWDAHNELHGLDALPSVTFEVWDTHEVHEVPWDRTSTLLRETFEKRYCYLAGHVLNTEIELAEAQQMLNAASRTVTDALTAIIGSDGAIKAVDLLVNVARREAALRIAAHDWNEGCAGVGCCADTPDMASDLIMTELSDDQRAELFAILAHD